MVKEMIGSIDGVDRIVTSIMDRMAIVTHNSDIDPLRMVSILNEKYLGASIKDIGKTKTKDDSTCFGTVREHMLFIAQLTIFVVAASTEKRVGGTITVILYASVILLSHRLFFSAAASMLMYRANADFLMAVAIFGSLLQTDLMTAALVALIVKGMDDLKDFVFRSVKKKLQGMVSTVETKVSLVKPKGATIEGSKLEVGMEFILRTGEVVPCDGVVVRGRGQVDESRITGEAILVEKSKELASKVSSGSMLQSGYLVIKAEAIAAESFGSRISDAVAQVQSTKTATQLLVDEFASWYTPFVILLAIFIGVYKESFDQFLLIIVAGCPCALVGAAPLVYGTTVAVLSSRQNLLVKSADALSSLACISVLGIDKTGTVTNGEFKLVDMKVFASKNKNQGTGWNFVSRTKNPTTSWSYNDVHRWAATVESADNHPLARSITSSYTGCVVAFAGGDELPPLSNFKRNGRCGVTGEVEGHSIGVGNADFLDLLKIKLSKPHLDLQKQWAEKGSIVYIVVDNELAALLLLNDTIRRDSVETVSRLNALGIKCSLLTGDKGSSVTQVSNAVNFESTHEGLLPEEKAQWIEKSKTNGESVGFIGDGLNDCIALAAANVGISIQEIGSQATADAASAVLQGDIGHLPGAIIVARRANKLVLANIFLALALNIAVIVIVISKEIPLWLSVLADGSTLLLVLCNSLWPLCWHIPPVPGGEIAQGAMISRFQPMDAKLEDP